MIGNANNLHETSVSCKQGIAQFIEPSKVYDSFMAGEELLIAKRCIMHQGRYSRLFHFI